MKNTWKKIVVSLVLLSVLLVMSARAAVSVYADEIAASSNTVTTGTVHETNAANPPVRIDEMGIHVGGASPVDINVPDLARRHGESVINGFHMTGIVAILCTFGLPVLIIAIAGYFGHRRNRLAHETLRAMIEKGMPITPELVAEIRNKSSDKSPGETRHRRLLPGLMLAGIGAALLIGGSKGEARGGWIVLFIGVAFLIVWFVEQKSSNNSQPPR